MLPYYNKKILGQNSLMNIIKCDWNSPQVISVVGGGGKTSFIYTLADELVENGKKTIITTTTHMRVPKKGLSSNLNEILDSLNQYGCAVAGQNPFRKRMCTVDDDVYKEMCKEADVVLVEADGAKRLPVKAPDLSHEPVIPDNNTYTVAIAGMSAIGSPMEEVCFRLEQIKKIVEIEDFTRPLTEELLAKILVGGYQVDTYILNQVDNDEVLKKAEQVASYYPDKEFIATSFYTNQIGKKPENLFIEKTFNK